jgi:hypothetical protein
MYKNFGSEANEIINELHEQVIMLKSRSEVAPEYLAKVATGMFVLDLRDAVEKALKSGMQYGTVVGTLHFMITEVTDDAKASLPLQSSENPSSVDPPEVDRA